VEDVADVLTKCATYEERLGMVVNLGSGRSVTLNTLSEVIARAIGNGLSIHYSGQFRLGDIRHAVAGMKVYEKIFGPWHPTSLEFGIAKYLQWHFMQEPPPITELDKSFKEMQLNGILLDSNSGEDHA
jgi:dTDP-L-rhamnose 4-epimerase